MISWSDSKSPAIETQDEAAQIASNRPSVQQLSDSPHADDNDPLTETCFHDRDYVQKMKEFQFYVDTVKKITRPGCSPEMVNVALSSMSSLVKTLFVISSKQYMHASL